MNELLNFWLKLEQWQKMLEKRDLSEFGFVAVFENSTEDLKQ